MHRSARSRMCELRRNVAYGNKNKSSDVQTRVGQAEFGRIHGQIAIRQKIQVQRARPPMDLSLAATCVFNAMEPREQFIWCKTCLGKQCGVQECALIFRAANW